MGKGKGKKGDPFAAFGGKGLNGGKGKDGGKGARWGKGVYGCETNYGYEQVRAQPYSAWTLDMMVSSETKPPPLQD